LAGDCLAEAAVNALLRILVGRSWPTDVKARWALIAPDGSLVEEGESDPSHWPAADQCEAIVSCDQAVWQRVRLPEGLPRGEFTRVLANVLEDKLIDDSESQHLTVTSRQGEDVRVLVIARKRLRDIVTRFAALGRPLSRLYSELQVSPCGEDGWHMALIGTSAILRRDSEDGVSLDVAEDGSPPPLVVDVAASIAAHGEPSPVLTVHSPDGSRLPNLDSWAVASGLEVRGGAPYRWYAVTGKANDLLHGEFAPVHRHRALLSSIRPALWLAALIMAADLVLGAVQVGWLRYQLSESQERMTSMFNATFPNTPAVSPAMQTKKELDRLRSPLGLLRADDALTLLVAVSESMDVQTGERIQRLRFEEGTLEITLGHAGGLDSGALARQLDVRGLAIAQKTGNDGNAMLTIRRKLK
jgi:general secretion pathway protein L